MPPACYDGAVKQVRTLGELRELCADPLILWAAQDIGSNAQVWAHGSAVIVAVTGLARRDRAAVTGEVTDIATVLRALLAGPGPRYRALGEDATISRLCQVLTGLTPTPPFGWMTTSQAPSHGAGSARLASTGDHAAIAQVLDQGFPDSLARPGLPGITRW